MEKPQWFRIFTFVTFMLLLPSISNTNANYSTITSIKLDAVVMELVSKVDVEILASVPKGSPIDKESINYELGDCSGFGYRRHPILKVRRMHKGFDFPGKIGTPVLSTAYGRVTKTVKSRSGYGNYVVVTSGNYETKYAHLSKILVEENQRVKLGDTLGLMGSSGMSTGPHLHYEVWKVGVKKEALDPLPFIKGVKTQ